MQNSINKTTRYVLAATTLLVAQGALAQAPSLMVNVGPCIALETAVERYTCYERQVNGALNGGLAGQGVTTVPAPSSAPATNNSNNVARPVQQSAAPVTVTRPTSSATAPASTPAAPVAVQTVPQGTVATQDTFGFPDKAEDGAVNEVNSMIAALEEIRPGQYVVTLENGQIWRQTRVDTTMRLEAGQHVRIYPTRWGDDYRMSVEELKGFVQVTRTR